VAKIIEDRRKSLTVKPAAIEIIVVLADSRGVYGDFSRHGGAFQLQYRCQETVGVCGRSLASTVEIFLKCNRNE
jgi:hypothetical protein